MRKGASSLPVTKVLANGEVMEDPVLATALLDRLLHHAQVINIRGNSYRLKDRIKAGIYGAPNLRSSD